MITKLDDIENVLESILTNSLNGDENVFMNRLDPKISEKAKEKFVFCYFLGDKTSSSERNLGQYALEAEYVFECLVAETDQDTALIDARALAGKVQDILLKNAEKPKTYFDLQYVSSQLLKDMNRSVPLVGYKLIFKLNYLASI